MRTSAPGSLLSCIFTELFLTIVFFASGFGVAVAGDVSGKVVITRSVTTDSRILSRSIIRRYTGQQSDGHAMHQEEPPAIVVYLTGIEVSKADAGKKEVVILDQKNERFIPHVLPILVGTTVDFLNSDDVYHNVFSYSPAKSFDLGRYKRGKSRSVIFDKPGVVKVYCDIHTHMNAFILVLKNPYFTVTDEDGNYRIEDVPAGRYTVKAWHGRWPEKAKTIDLREGRNATVNFEFP